MIKIIRGKFKNINIRVSEKGDVIVKAPKYASTETIMAFIDQKKRWLERQYAKAKETQYLKSKYDFEKYCYINLKPYPCENKKYLFYLNAFKQEVVPLVELLSKQHKLYFNLLKLTQSKRIWGSLDSNKTIRLNWKIIILPKELIIYIIVHELCHIKEFNHSKVFWQQVEKILPNYKALKKQLASYSFILTADVLK